MTRFTTKPNPDNHTTVESLRLADLDPGYMELQVWESTLDSNDYIVWMFVIRIFGETVEMPITEADAGRLLGNRRYWE